MPPKRKQLLPTRPLRRSQRMKTPKKPAGPPVTIDLDEVEDAPETMTRVPLPVADDFPAEESEDDPYFQTDEPEDEEFYDAEDEEEEDCEVVGDEDCDAEVRYADEDRDGNRNRVGLDDDEHVTDEDSGDDFEAVFGNVAGEDDEHVTDEDSGDDIWDDDTIPDHISSEDESELETIPHVRQPKNLEDYLRLGRTFNCPEDFKAAVLRYSLKTKYDIMLYRAQRRRIGAKCSDMNCQWRCYCSYDKKKRKMQIKVYVGEHSCVRSGYSKMLKQGTIAKLYFERLRKNPKITPVVMAEEIKREYNLSVTVSQCAKAKTKVLKDRKKTHEQHFSHIWDYQAEIFRTNPGTTFDIETVPGPTVGSLPRFLRLFVCFKAQRETWRNTCRPILGVDGAFLKWDIKGHLLAATGRDGDNRIVPVAWAIVEIENDDNWDWFMRKLAGSLDLQDGRHFAIISDRQAGLVKAIQNVIPQAEHRHCARHILENWRKNSHDMELQRLFWKVARSYTEGEYVAYMQELRSYNPGAFTTLVNTNPRTWSRAFFRIGSCCNDNLNNLSESFNRTIRGARKMPLLDLLEDIRRQCMVRNEKRHVIASRLTTKFTKRASAEIEKMIEGSQHCERWMARHDKHEVRLGNDNFLVDMNDSSCGCRKWQMTGIPCVHAASVIIGKKQKVEDYVADWYTSKMWQMTYDDGIAPCQGMLAWPIVDRIGMLPPPSRKGNPGRPKNHARRQGVNEASTSKLSKKNRVMTCSNCKEEGHNTKGCTNARVQSPPRRPRGRPRKTVEPRNILFGQGFQQRQATMEPQGVTQEPRVNMETQDVPQEGPSQGSQALSSVSAN